MCDYCKNPPVPLYFAGVDHPVVAVRDDSIEIMYYKRRFLREKHVIEHKPINFCPMCGRNLKGDAS